MTGISPRNKSSSRRTLLVAVGTVILVWLICVCWPVGERLISRLDQVFHDELLRQGEGAALRNDLVLLGIDDASLGNSGASDEEIARSEPLQMLGERFPCDRRVWAAVIERLAEAGAKGIVIDLILDAPSDPGADEELAAAIERHKDKIILTSVIAPTAQSGGNVFSLLEPYDPFLGFDYDVRVGFANFQVDPIDGLVRSARYTTTMGRENHEQLEGEEVVLSLAAQMIDLLGGDVPVGDRQLAFVHGGRTAATEVYAPISLSEIFIDATWRQNFGGGAYFKDKLVVIGPVAPRFQDIHSTPVGPLTGPQLHLQAVTCGMEKAFFRATERTTLPFWAFAIASVAFLPLSRRPVVATTGVLTLLGLLVAGAWWMSHRTGLFLPVAGAGAVLLFTYLFTQSEQLLSERFERRRLRTAFRRLVSHDVADRLVESPQRYQKLAEGELREVVVLFSDVRGFTSRSESQSPTETVSQLNEYLSAMVAVVFRHGGTLDKFIGDAVMAHWGALDQVEGDDHAEAALAAARQMQTELEGLNQRWLREGKEPMEVGIGVHRGEVLVGEIGSAERSEFGVIGDAVNLSSRIEGLCKAFGAQLIYSSAVGSAGIDLGTVRVKGRREAVQLYGEGDPQRITESLSQIPVGSDGNRDLS